MKKNVLGFALLAMSFVAFNSFAQSTTTTPAATCATTGCTAKAQCDKQGKGKGQCNAEGKKQCKADLFAGINLTEAQKTQLEQLKATRKAACEKARTERKAQKEAMKKDGNKQQLTPEQKQAKKQEMQAKKQEMKAKRDAEFRKYLQDVKSIIGADNYTKFLENMAVEKQGRHGDKAKNICGKKDRKGGDKGGKSGNRKGQKGQKGNKGQKGGAPKASNNAK